MVGNCSDRRWAFIGCDSRDVARVGGRMGRRVLGHDGAWVGHSLRRIPGIRLSSPVGGAAREAEQKAAQTSEGVFIQVAYKRTRAIIAWFLYRPPSSSGLGYMVLSHGTGVRIPVGVPKSEKPAIAGLFPLVTD